MSIDTNNISYLSEFVDVDSFSKETSIILKTKNIVFQIQLIIRNKISDFLNSQFSLEKYNFSVWEIDLVYPAYVLH